MSPDFVSARPKAKSNASHLSRCASPPLRSCDFDVALASDYDTEGQVTVVQGEPLPLDVLAVMPRIAMGRDNHRHQTAFSVN